MSDLNPFKKNNERRFNYESRYDSRNHFTSNKTPTFELNVDSFPEITSRSQDTTKECGKNSINFKAAISTVNLENNSREIEPGWLHIYINNETKQLEKKYGKTRYGKTRYGKTKQHNEDDYDINYQMSNIIDNLTYNWSRYKEQYDDINGEGAYDRRFYYKITDDTLEDEEDDDSEECYDSEEYYE